MGKLLEREGDLAAIGRLLAGGGGVGVIEGGAGIGKTSLLGAACDGAEESGWQVLRARGSELESGFAFGVVRQLFERRLVAADGVEQGALLAGSARAARAVILGERDELAADDASFAVLHGLYWVAANLAARPTVGGCGG